MGIGSGRCRHLFIRNSVRWFSTLGVDLVRMFLNLKNLLRFLVNRRRWKSLGGKIDQYYPILTDFDADAGAVRGHYFHQDLLVAKHIFDSSPQRHLDVGSRIDGFVAHVASFREIEVIDIRPVDIGHGIQSKQLDLTLPQTAKSDSVSCLHALEHFGLGRYGDEIDPEGHLRGFYNLVSLVSKGGMLYVSFPVSSKPRVEWNAHRVLSMTEIFDWDGSQLLELERFWLVGDDGKLIKDALPNSNISINYGCAIYAFRKK